MKRVLVVNTVATTFNGITSVIMNYTRSTYNQVSYDFVLCVKADAVFIEEMKMLGQNVYVAPCSRIKKPLKYSKWLNCVMKQNKYDCIHVHGNSATTYLEIKAAKKANIPIRIVHSHSTACIYKFIHRLLKPRMNKLITHAIACSDLAGKWLFNKDFLILQNAINVEKFKFSSEERDAYRRKLALEGKFVVGHIGYMETVKNHSFILDVAERVVEKNKDVCFLFIGDGSLRPSIEKSISERKLSDNVILLGKRSDVASLYQCMDVFILPSISEGLPVTAVEAQTAGLPCLISANVTRQVSITDSVKYIDINDSNIDEWAEAIQQIKVCDREKAFFAICESEFNIQIATKALLEIYNS